MPKTEIYVQLSGEDGNTLSIMGRVSRALKKDGHEDLAKEMQDRVFSCGSYDEALQIFMEYVEVG